DPGQLSLAERMIGLNQEPSSNSRAFGSKHGARPSRPLEQIRFAFDPNPQPWRTEQVGVAREIQPVDLRFIANSPPDFAHKRDCDERNRSLSELPRKFPCLTCSHRRRSRLTFSFAFNDEY